MVVEMDNARARWALKVLRVLPGMREGVVFGPGRWIAFGTHWVERLMLCPGEECVACGFGPPRVMCYRPGVLAVPGRCQPVLVEAPVSSVARLEGFMRMESIALDAAIAVDVSRPHRRSAIRIEPSGKQPAADAVPLGELVAVNACAVLFGLPLCGEGESARDWACRVRPVAASRLGAAVRALG